MRHYFFFLSAWPSAVAPDLSLTSWCCVCAFVYACMHLVGISWQNTCNDKARWYFQLEEEEEEEERWTYTTFTLEFAVCRICIRDMLILLKICVDIIRTCLPIIYVSLQAPNMTKIYFFFSFSESFPLITFSKWTSAGYRFLIKVTTQHFPWHRIDNPRWRRITTLVSTDSVLEDIWKIQCVALAFSISANIFLCLKEQYLLSKKPNN